METTNSLNLIGKMRIKFLFSAIILLLIANFNYSNSNVDLPKYSIIKWDKSYYWIFSNVTNATLTSREIKMIENLLSKAVKKHNSLKIDDAYKIKALANYYFQFVAVLNKKGEKEIWVNALCGTPVLHWQKETIIVKDGGNCYFNLKLNLTTRTYYQLYVNGYA